MTFRSLVVACAAAAALCFVPPVRAPVVPEVRRIDPGGRETPCAPAFARVEMPRHDGLSPLAPVHDLAYAAAEAGPQGCLWLLGACAFLALVRGLWSRGFRGALRRVLLVAALGAPLCLGLLYASSFLEGRVIRLGPEAAGHVAASLHVHTDRSTGLVSPENVVRWHQRRGFRVLNVSDRDSIRGGVLAREFAGELHPVPPLLVTVGDEWHGSPDVVFVNVSRRHEAIPVEGATAEERRVARLRRLRDLAAAVHAEGGALFVAHPWSKVPSELSLEDILEAGVDGVEVVNGAIHGGAERIRAAAERERALLGVLDYKYGPHVDAMTLLEERLSRDPQGVARAIQEGGTIVLHAVPGGVRSSEEWKAAEVGLRGALAALRSLFETPLPRRAVWLAWAVGALLLWWLAMRGDAPGMGRGAARALFAACAAAEPALLLFVWFRTRAVIGTVPVPILLGAAAVIAVPLLAANHALAQWERAR